MSETPHAETTQAFTQLLVDRLGNAHRILVDRYSLGSKVSAEIADSDDEIASTLRDAAMHLRAALRQPRPGTWQPMETAPKDGTQIWLWWDGKRRLAHWHEAENPPSIGGRFANWLTDDRGSVSAVTKPRLWCPCPSPPQTETP